MEIHPYGEWPSPLSPERATGSTPRYGDLLLSVSDLGHPLVWWSVVESGRGVIWRAAVKDGRATDQRRFDVVDSVRSRVNEYGGGSFWVRGETLFWVEDADQRIRRLDPDGHVTVLTPEPPVTGAWRHSCGVMLPGRDWMIVERELHTDLDGSDLAEPVNELACVATDHPESHTLVRGADFVAEPVLSPDGTHLAWLQWDHPNMPWTAAELWAAEITREDPPRIRSPRRLAGGVMHGRSAGLERGVSVCGPQWSPLGVLHFCDDSADRWLLRRMPSAGLPPESVGESAVPIHDGSGEVGEPRWVGGGSRYGFSGNEDILLAENVDGLGSLGVLHGESGEYELLPFDYTWIQSLAVSRDIAVAIAGSGLRLTAPTVIDHSGGNSFSLAPDTPSVESASISRPERITYPTADAEVAHGLFYEPKLAGVSGPDSDKPPLLVRIHGGPTAEARSEYSSSVQFWTMAGFAVLDVNYRGSSGFGRRYRDLLNGEWGVAEVADCIHAAEYLAGAGRVDPLRCVIRGGSAGGFTALEAVCASATKSGFHFAAATSLYGVTDLTAMAADTHKFEARYLDALVGPLPQAEERYRQRSPLAHPERIGAPVLILQGLADRVVPPSQAEVLVDAMRHNGIDHEYKTYEGEGHGFRQPATISDALEREMRFYGRVMGFEPAVLEGS